MASTSVEVEWAPIQLRRLRCCSRDCDSDVCRAHEEPGFRPLIAAGLLCCLVHLVWTGVWMTDCVCRAMALDMIAKMRQFMY